MSNDQLVESKPCQSCDVEVQEGDELGYDEEWLCPDCFTSREEQVRDFVKFSQQEADNE